MVKRKAVQTVLPGVSADLLASSQRQTVPSTDAILTVIGRRYISIYEDVLTRRNLEGKAQVMSVDGVKAHDGGYVLVTATVHFKGDAKWMRNSRQFLMRG